MLAQILMPFGIGQVFQGANVSDREDDWTKTYRVPDVLVFLEGTSAADRKTHWFGDPEFAVEIISLGDRAFEKLEFYASVETDELLVVDRDPWTLSLYRLTDGSMALVGQSISEDDSSLKADILPLTFHLQQSEITIVDTSDGSVHSVWVLASQS